MHPSNARKRFGPVLAAIVAVLIAAAPVAAASTSATASESLTVTASITLSGVPATLTYPSVNAGSAAVAPEFAAAVSSNNSTGWSFSVNATDLTAGPNTIAKTSRQYTISGTGFTATGGGSPTDYPGGDFVLATKGGAGSANVFTTPRVVVPAGTPPGAYTGSAVFTASTNP